MHVAKTNDGEVYSHPASPPQQLSRSDVEIFEEMLRRRLPGLRTLPQSYARDYRDADGQRHRIVAATFEGIGTRVADSSRGDIKGYEVSVRYPRG